MPLCAFGDNVMKLNQQLLEVLRHVNGLGFPETHGRVAAVIMDEEMNEYSIVDGIIELLGDYKPGIWIMLQDSDLNDGLYRIKSRDNERYTLENGSDDEIPTNDEISFVGRVWVIRIDNNFISLVKDILKFNEKNVPGSKKSESFGQYSYTRSSGENGASIGWETEFKVRLNAFRRMLPSVVI
jgi:hypothetical protein